MELSDSETKVSVLVVDDNIINRKQLARLLIRARDDGGKGTEPKGTVELKPILHLS